MSYNHVSAESATARTDYIRRGYWSAGRAKQAAVVARPEHAEFTVFPAFLAVVSGIGRILRNKRLAVRAYLVSFLNGLNGFFLSFFLGFFRGLFCRLLLALVFLVPFFTAVSQPVNAILEEPTAGKPEYVNQQQVVPGEGAGVEFPTSIEIIHHLIFLCCMVPVGLTGGMLCFMAGTYSLELLEHWLERRRRNHVSAGHQEDNQNKP